MDILWIFSFFNKKLKFITFINKSVLLCIHLHKNNWWSLVIKFYPILTTCQHYAELYYNNLSLLLKRVSRMCICNITFREIKF